MQNTEPQSQVYSASSVHRCSAQCKDACTMCKTRCTFEQPLSFIPLCRQQGREKKKRLQNCKKHRVLRGAPSTLIHQRAHTVTLGCRTGPRPCMLTHILSTFPGVLLSCASVLQCVVLASPATPVLNFACDFADNGNKRTTQNSPAFTAPGQRFL